MYWVNTMVRKLNCIEPTPKVRQGLVPADFALIITYYCCACRKIINKYMQKAGEPDNDAAVLRVIIIAAVHVAS